MNATTHDTTPKTPRPLLILDMGGVLMQHDMPTCLSRFRNILGEENMRNLLGLETNGEGTANTLMALFERGEISANAFIDSILQHAKSGTTAQDVKNAWNAMHGHIPTERLQMLSRWHDAGYHLFLLSNNNELHWADICNHYDISVFDHCFLSHLIHLSKPDVSIYTAVQEYLHQHDYQGDICFVDDLSANREPAETLGWQTFSTLEELDQYLAQ